MCLKDSNCVIRAECITSNISRLSSNEKGTSKFRLASLDDAYSQLLQRFEPHCIQVGGHGENNSQGVFEFFFQNT
jgi:hypothetical protein